MRIVLSNKDHEFVLGLYIARYLTPRYNIMQEQLSDFLNDKDYL